MPPPNIIFIITDDQGYGDVACHGNPWLKTPHLDQLAHESVRLDNHHHDPLCSPSRAALLTGQYAARNGVWHVVHGRHLLNPAAVTMADVFSENGYRTALFGKWHLGDNFPFAPRFRGFDEVLCHKGGGVGELPDFWGNNYVDDTYFRNGAPEKCSGYCTDVFFDAALDFIAADSDAPFFIYLATNAMHAPHIVPHACAAPYLAHGFAEERARFYGMIANFDENLGRLLSHLDEHNLADDTIVVFTSDHGTAAGYNAATADGFNAGLRGKKGAVYDGGHQVSFFLRWRRHLQPNLRIRELTAHIDILPTLIDLCALRFNHEHAFDGVSLASLLHGDETELPTRSVVVQLQTDTPRKWNHCAVLRGDWRLINGDELYNVAIDRAQQRDIAADNQAMVASLRRDYEQWWRSMQASFAQSVAIPVGSPVENPVLLSARDWRPTSGRVPWMQAWIDDPAYDANGYWLIDVCSAGHYVVELRTHPREAERPLGSLRARLEIGDARWERPAAPGACSVEFEVGLRAGVTALHTLLLDLDSKRERGAYYVYVQKL